MKISVIVPVYKDLRLNNLLESLTHQSLGLDEFEVIIVDNANCSEVLKIYEGFCNKLNLILLWQEKRGSYIARNTGIKVASGEILAFTDADCVVAPDWLRNLVQPFLDPNIGGVGGRIIKYLPASWIEKGTRDLAEGQKTTQKLAFTNLPFIVTANAAYRRNLVVELGGFDEAFESGGDVDLSWRIILAGYKIGMCPDAIVYHYSRTTLRRYFWQYAGYTTGQVLLFKKYSWFHNRKVFFHSYPFRGFYYVLTKLPSVLIDILKNRDNSQAQHLLLEFVMHCGILFGDIRGAYKYRVIYI